MDSAYILTLSCPDKVGIVYAVTGFLAANNCNIMSSHQYGDPESVLFFMRVKFRAEEGAPDLEGLLQRFAHVAERFAMRWQIKPASEKTRALILVSRQGHCLNDLLFRTHTGELALDIAGIASNHNDFQEFAGWHELPYHYLPVRPESKAEQEQRLLNIIEREKVELVILARYMQILSEALCRDLSGRCINIHHSFLPGFKGARPYHQAHAHGVKLIGATAHYVTANLDEGPIIEQDVQRVDHAHSPEDLAAIGRDVEAVVLARAVRYHTEHRVLINGRKTVVLR
ncbi:formyltetrahydrofolate deformylase [Desulfovibrio sp. OttesenSCG-928-C14]|nr:formyltetrahydrofolate deformylase [Desulfovibrio sp. OttesenSCG-928-C14]